MGAMAIVEAAESFAQNRPSGAEKEAMNAVNGFASVAVRFKLQKTSFQQRIIDNSAVEAIPGSAKGSST